MDTVYVIRLVVGLAMTVAALAVSGRRAFWLYRLIRTGQRPISGMWKPGSNSAPYASR